MSDHFSGFRALAAPVADITDVYAFPSPERPGCLVLVMNVLPFASPSALFSDAIIYRFRLRPVTIASVGPGASFAVGTDEYTFDCRFTSPASPNGSEAMTQEGTCIGPAGASVTFRVNDEAGGQGTAMRAFAGTRLDSFFIDGVAVATTMITHTLQFKTPSHNNFDGLNALSIVVEAETAELFGRDAGPLFAVIGETVTAGAPSIRVERVGRPEIKNVILSSKDFDQVNHNLEIRDLYNEEDAFDLAPVYLGAYGARLNANLAFYDGLDDKTDWTPDAKGHHPLTNLLLADFLVVDTSKPFADGAFLEIEQAMLAGTPHQTCGGRPLNDDIIDTLYGWMINAGTGPHISDGVDHATVPASRTFPYLAQPNPNPPPRTAPPSAAVLQPEPYA
ncbi:MAG: DUF4331 family protein [Dehalococcoidia bacterium]